MEDIFQGKYAYAFLCSETISDFVGKKINSHWDKKQSLIYVYMYIQSLISVFVTMQILSRTKEIIGYSQNMG